MIIGKHSATVLRNKDQVSMKLKNAVSARSICIVFSHRPNIIESMKQTKTLKVRVKDKHRPLLNNMARSVNFVWNYVNELSHRSIKERGVFLSAYTIQKYTQGVHKELGLHSHTVQKVGAEYATRRRQFKKSRLSWRKSGGVRRSLGWIPINTGMAKWKNGQVYHNGHYFNVWDSYGLSQYTFKSASFNEDARGRWYFNVVVEVDVVMPKGQDCIGIDLGLTDTATCSDGTKLEAGRFYRGLEEKLAIAQRARNKTQVKTIHAKIANRRKDTLHKFSRTLVNRCGEIYVGNVSSLKLVKTKMAKSVLDAGWGQLKTMLKYKSDHAGIVFKEVNEAYTTQTCSCCGALPDSRPRGIAGLGIREWTCSACGVTHSDRDVNAAKNILAVGHGRLAVGIPAL
ncbi:transposase [Thiopseudomonas alkaliphila]|nr:transposase [Thiopseudomonas alkaliphila]